MRQRGGMKPCMGASAVRVCRRGRGAGIRAWLIGPPDRPAGMEPSTDESLVDPTAKAVAPLVAQ